MKKFAFPAKLLIAVTVLAFLLSCGGGSGNEIGDNRNPDTNPTPHNPGTHPDFLDVGYQEKTFQWLQDEIYQGELTYDRASTNGATVETVLVSEPIFNSLSFGADGTFTYHAPADFAGTDSFFFRFASGNTPSEVHQVQLEILPRQSEVESPWAFVFVGQENNVKFNLKNHRDPEDISVWYRDNQLPIIYDDASYQVTVAVPELERIHVGSFEQLVIRTLDEHNQVIEYHLDLFPVIAGPSPDDFTIHGNQTGEGFDLVFVNDRYKAEEKTKFFLDVMKVAKEFLSEPVLEQTLAHWNIHIRYLEPDSGGRTPIRSYFGCQNLDRLICGDNTIAEALVREVFPFSDQTAVLVNSKTHGGSGGSVIYASTHADMSRIMLHELGHSYALLADEYSENISSIMTHAAKGQYPHQCQKQYQINTFESVRSSNANVSSTADPAEVPWRHWIEDIYNIPGIHFNEESGLVGIFKGAFYTPFGWYRPTYTSLMRDANEPLYAVNGEAWMLASYDFIFDHEDVFWSAQSSSFQPAEFSVKTTLKSPLFEYVWKVDGVVENDARGETYFTCCEKPGNYHVELSIVNKSEFIRKLGPDNVIQSREWKITILESD